MNNKQLQQQIDNMKAELAEMEALLNQPAINYWQPSVLSLDKYYYISTLGTIRTDTANDSDISRYRVFKTETEASHYLEYIKAEETLRKAIAEANQGWLPNWNTHIEDKWCIELKAGLSDLKETCNKSYKCFPYFMYIKSGKLATYLMSTYRKEFITYLSY